MNYWVGLQQYTELESIRCGEPAYLEPVIVLKIGKFLDKIYLCFKQFLAAIISGEMYVFSARCANLFLRFGTQ